MAIVQCPVCHRRISSMARVCPHCAAPLGEMTPQLRREQAQVRRQRQTAWAKRVSLFALAMTFVGAMGWWFDAGTGWQWPPPMWSVTLLTVGVGLYLVGRGWLLWLYWTRSTVSRLL